MMSNKWITANEIYKPTIKQVDRSKMIYRTSDGFEAFVVGECTYENENDCWIIEGNGVKSKVWKHTTKNSIKRVSADYELKKFNSSI
jgi:hypothetical protein